MDGDDPCRRALAVKQGLGTLHDLDLGHVEQAHPEKTALAKVAPSTFNCTDWSMKVGESPLPTRAGIRLRRRRRNPR